MKETVDREISIVLINLIVAAFERHGTDISPVSKNTRFRDCMSIGPYGEAILWYDTPDGSTHIVRGQ